MLKYINSLPIIASIIIFAMLLPPPYKIAIAVILLVLGLVALNVKL